MLRAQVAALQAIVAAQQAQTPLNAPVAQPVQVPAAPQPVAPPADTETPEMKRKQMYC